jgi:dTDP-4-amino-4,6-dideoxygalactose transaminase
MLEFERHLAEFVGTREAVGVSNCTDGIRLLAHALDVGPTDSVATVAHTFVATISPFKLRGATPVLVDIGDDHNMDPHALEAAIDDRTRVVVPVHLNGRSCDMDPILKIAESVGATVVEDAAQSLGAKYKGRGTGTFGLAAVYSFYPAKLLGALGDAGAVVTDDASLADELRLLRDHGRASKTELAAWGYNCRLDNLQAAVLDYRLRELPGQISRRRQLAARYDEAFAPAAQVQTLPGPDADSDYFDVYQNYPILVERRDDLVEHLRSRGIETLVSWPVPLHRQHQLGFQAFDLPVTDRLSANVVSLPLFPGLEDGQIDYVAESVAQFLT